MLRRLLHHYISYYPNNAYHIICKLLKLINKYRMSNYIRLTDKMAAVTAKKRTSIENLLQNTAQNNR